MKKHMRTLLITIMMTIMTFFSSFMFGNNVTQDTIKFPYLDSLTGNEVIPTILGDNKVFTVQDILNKVNTDVNTDITTDDLIFTTNRTHDLNGKRVRFQIDGDSTENLFSIAPTEWIIGFNEGPFFDVYHNSATGSHIRLAVDRNSTTEDYSELMIRGTSYELTTTMTGGQYNSGFILRPPNLGYSQYYSGEGSTYAGFLMQRIGGAGAGMELRLFGSSRIAIGTDGFGITRYFLPTTSSPTANQILSWPSFSSPTFISPNSLIVTNPTTASNSTLSVALSDIFSAASGGGGISGTGIDDYAAIWRGDTLTTGIIRDDGVNAAINAAPGPEKFVVSGDMRVTTSGSDIANFESSVLGTAYVNILNTNATPATEARLLLGQSESFGNFGYITHYWEGASDVDNYLGFATGASGVRIRLYNDKVEFFDNTYIGIAGGSNEDLYLIDPTTGSADSILMWNASTGLISVANPSDLVTGKIGTATLDFPNTTTGTSSDLTITVTGAAIGDIVSVGVPNGSVNANSCFTAWVSGSNTVTVRFNNYSGSDIDPASGTFKVKVE